MSKYQEAQQKLAQAEKAVESAKTRKELTESREEVEFWSNKAAYYYSQGL